MPKNFKDFDAFYEEAGGDKLPGLSFQYGGETFDLPASLPAVIPVKAIRLKREYGDEADIPEAESLELALGLFGEEQLQRLLATGISIDRLGDIIKWAMESYQDRITEAAQGNAPSRAGARRPK